MMNQPKTAADEAAMIASLHRMPMPHVVEPITPRITKGPVEYVAVIPHPCVKCGASTLFLSSHYVCQSCGCGYRELCSDNLWPIVARMRNKDKLSKAEIKKRLRKIGHPEKAIDEALKGA